MERSSDLWDDGFGAYAPEPGLFFEELLGWKPWWKQLEIAEAVRDAVMGRGPRRIAVRSGNGVGKTALAARMMLWALRSWKGSVVITTAPTQRQVDQLLWREAREAFEVARHPLGGRFGPYKSRWELGPRRFALGFSSEHARPEAFQGFHAAVIFFIVDEASGVPEAHWQAIKGSALAGNAVIFAIGNPTRTHGEFYEAFHRNAVLWKTLHISAFDTPNLTPGAPPVPGLVTPEAVEEAKADWGEESPLYAVRVLGEFPRLARTQLIALEWVEAALARPAEPGPAALGVDVARSGEDETVLALMTGNRIERIEAWRGQDTMRTAGAVHEYAARHKDISIAIDDGGVGGGVVDRLREMNVAVHAVKFGAPPEGKQALHFKNKLAEMYWVLARWLEEGKLSLVDDRKLTGQLTQIEWEQESDRAIRVYKRGRREEAASPDRADAVALALEAQLRRQRVVGIYLGGKD